VLSDLPHQLEVLRASGAGLAAAPERPAEFADAILRLVDDRSAAQRMGRSGQAAFLAKYSYESQLGEMLRFYRRVLGAPA
jgi:glycosyltransferase involved in cell wall biosynthesis